MYGELFRCVHLKNTADITYEVNYNGRTSRAAITSIVVSDRKDFYEMLSETCQLLANSDTVLKTYSTLRT